MPAEKRSISLNPEQLARLEARKGERSPLSMQIQEDLELLWLAVDTGLATCRRLLVRSEAKLILDVMNGTDAISDGRAFSLIHWLGSGPEHERTGSGLEHQVDDGIRLDGLDRKWEIDGPALLAKIQRLDRLALLGLLDWCAVMWDHCEDSGYWEKELATFPAAKRS